MLACIVFTAIPAANAPGQAATASPNLLINADRIRAIKAQIKAGNPVITEAYRQLIADADSYLKLTPNPIVGELRVPGFYTKKREEQRAIVSRIRPDAKAANCLALAFAISDDRKYALKAREFIFAWVNNLGKPRDGGSLLDGLLMERKGDTQLVITYTFPNFIYAFDILDGLGVLSDTERDSFRSWLRIYVDYCRKECLIKNNHHNWQSLFLMCSGHVLRDRDLFETGVRYYKRGFNVQVTKDGAMPLELWREEKGATYTLMALEAMLQGAHIAAAHGHPEVLEMRSRDKGNLKAAVDCLVSFLDQPDKWQVERRKELPGYAEKLNHPDAPTDWGWILEIPYSLWKDNKYPVYMHKCPYGDAIRAYTLEYSTLLFAEQLVEGAGIQSIPPPASPSPGLAGR